jgi:hypothetical protein
MIKLQLTDGRILRIKKSAVMLIEELGDNTCHVRTDTGITYHVNAPADAVAADLDLDGQNN